MEIQPRPFPEPILFRTTQALSMVEYTLLLLKSSKQSFLFSLNNSSLDSSVISGYLDAEAFRFS